MGDQHLLVGPEWAVNDGFGGVCEFTFEGKRLWLANAGPGERVGAFEDMGLAVKKVVRPGVLQEKPGPSLATEIEAQLPTTTEHGAGLSGTIIATQQMGIAKLHFNGLIARNREHDFAWAASVIVELAPKHWKLEPVTEVSIDREGNAPTDHGVLGGFLWEAAPSLTIDGAVRYSSNAEHEVELLWGFTWKKHIKNGSKI